MQLRQGDILLVKTGERNTWDVAEVPDGIIALGEATGHAHRIEGGTLERGGPAGLIVRSDGGAKLVHEEHDTIEIPEGTYRVYRQREEGERGNHFVAD